MKKIIFICILFFIIPYGTFAAATNDDCESISDAFAQYQCKSQKICKQYDENKKVFNIEIYKSAESYKKAKVPGNVLVVSDTQINAIAKAITIYKENMNSVYKCAVVQAQKNSYNKILQFIGNKNIKALVEPKIKQRLENLKVISKANKCLNIDSTTIFNKLSILRQTTYLTCDYNVYMNYLGTYFSDFQKLYDLENVPKSEAQEARSVTEAAKDLQRVAWDISLEIEQAYKVFPLAYHAYWEYEDNFPVHFLLELLKEDYQELRQKLHQVLNPINQVVYKISNAMKQ